MLNITIKRDGDVLTVYAKGKIDTNSANQLESEVHAAISGVKTLVMDFQELDYISSAGIRVLLLLSRDVKGEKNVVIRNASNTVREVFLVTGLIKSFNFE